MNIKTHKVKKDKEQDLRYSVSVKKNESGFDEILKVEVEKLNDDRKTV